MSGCQTHLADRRAGQVECQLVERDRGIAIIQIPIFQSALQCVNRPLLFNHSLGNANTDELVLHGSELAHAVTDLESDLTKQHFRGPWSIAGEFLH
jgi:hypothetical protein